MIIDAKPKISLALSGARNIRSQVTSLQALSGTFSYDVLEKPIGAMQVRYNLDIKPLVDAYTLQQIQTATEVLFPFGEVPANLRTLLVNIGSAVAIFNTAFGSIFAGAGNVRTFTPATGTFGWINVSIASLGSLVAPLNAIGAACDLVAYDG